MAWTVHEGGVCGPEGFTPVRLRLPGRFNLGNAAMALATAAALGVPPAAAAAAIAGVTSIAGRYSVVDRGRHKLRLLLAKNPAGWSELLPLLADAPAVLLVVQCAGRRRPGHLVAVGRPVRAARGALRGRQRGARADAGLRLSYAGIEHRTSPTLWSHSTRMPPGEVQVVANYTAFLALRRRVSAEAAS